MKNKNLIVFVFIISYFFIQTTSLFSIDTSDFLKEINKINDFLNDKRNTNIVSIDTLINYLKTPSDLSNIENNYISCYVSTLLCASMDDRYHDKRVEILTTLQNSFEVTLPIIQIIQTNVLDFLIGQNPILNVQHIGTSQHRVFYISDIQKKYLLKYFDNSLKKTSIKDKDIYYINEKNQEFLSELKKFDNYITKKNNNLCSVLVGNYTGIANYFPEIMTNPSNDLINTLFICFIDSNDLANMEKIEDIKRGYLQSYSNPESIWPWMDLLLKIKIENWKLIHKINFCDIASLFYAPEIHRVWDSKIAELEKRLIDSFQSIVCNITDINFNKVIRIINVLKNISLSDATANVNSKEVVGDSTAPLVKDFYEDMFRRNINGTVFSQKVFNSILNPTKITNNFNLNICLYYFITIPNSFKIEIENKQSTVARLILCLKDKGITLVRTLELFYKYINTNIEFSKILIDHLEKTELKGTELTFPVFASIIKILSKSEFNKKEIIDLFKELLKEKVKKEEEKIEKEKIKLIIIGLFALSSSNNYYIYYRIPLILKEVFNEKSDSLISDFAKTNYKKYFNIRLNLD